MMAREAEKKQENTGAKRNRGEDLPPGRVRCFICKQVYDESETVELDYNGGTVRVHKKYAKM